MMATLPLVVWFDVQSMLNMCHYSKKASVFCSVWLVSRESNIVVIISIF